MKHTYKVTGMTCNSCAIKVKSELLKLSDVINAEVSQTNGEAVIEMQHHIALNALQEAVSRAGNYSITAADAHIENQMTTSETSWLKTYKPLLLVVGFILIVSIAASFSKGTFEWMDWMNYFMAGFFITFSFFKFLDLKGFADSYSTYDLLAMRWRTYGFIYPFIELALGIAYIVGWEPITTNFVTAVVMGFSSLGVINSLLKKRTIQCACLGTVFNLPMSNVTLIEDAVMFFMAIGMLIIV